MKADNEARLSGEVSKKAEEHDPAQLKIEKGVYLSLEARRRAEEQYHHARLKYEEEKRLVEEARLKYQEEGKIYG